MSHEIKPHVAQTAILRELLFQPSATYACLQKPTGLTSDHFAFHVARLVELGMVEKLSRGTYRLTPNGKEYANRLDTDNSIVERQPKSAVILAVERTRGGAREFVFQERLKNPYYGFWGLATGKIRWGETIEETAGRELLEETGLQADWRIAGVYHEHVIHSESGDYIEDKIFFVAHGTNPQGELLADFEGGHNEWLTHEAAICKPKKFVSFATELEIIDSKQWFHETVITYGSDDF